LGMALTFPMAAGIGEEMSNFFPVFVVENKTLITAFSFAIVIGLLASLFPIRKAMTTKIVDGLRHVG
jgi:putative ABC transport system permease protein